MTVRNKIIYTSLIMTFACSPAISAPLLDYLNPADPTSTQAVTQNLNDAVITQKAKLTRNDIHNHYTIAMQRFMQANVKSAYANFKILIDTIVPNDYAYLKLADEMAEIGLFNLSKSALDNVSDHDLAFIQGEDIKKFYFPKNMLQENDEIYLAEVYSNIIYNAQSKEATAELLKNTGLLQKSDYANYLAALGLLKNGEVNNAEIFIENALKINPNNLNYQKLKIEIKLQSKNPQSALKLLSTLKNDKLYTEDYVKKVKTLEQYTLYKTEKNETLKKYHLAYYYYWQQDYTKAARTLQTAITTKKSTNREVYALLSEVYFMQKEYEKAENYAQKALELGGNNKQALMVLGKIKYNNKQYKEALKYFKNAESKNDTEPSAWLGMTYLALGDSAKTRQINSKILKEHSDCVLAYYNMAREDKDREYEYMKKAVALNLGFIEGWIGLAKNAIEKGKLDNAQKYLGIVKYIDENDFRYYYYQGMMYKAKGLTQDANYYFKKSLTLNPDYELAKRELGI